jgi:hypothetical protein
MAARIAPGKVSAEQPLGPNMLTEERPIFDASGFALGLEFGVTVSELHQVRPQSGRGLELVHVVNPDGTSNLETVLARAPIGGRQRLELQGPALNSDRSALLPLGARFLGVGLTSDLVDRHAQEAVSYTLEVKATERTAAEVVRWAAPGVAAEAARFLGREGASGAAGLAAQVMAGAVPVVGGLLAISSARWAWRVLHTPQADAATKSLAVGHALFDAARIAFPLAGAAANAALVGVAVGVGAVKVRKLKKERALQRAEAAPPPPEAPVADPGATP